MQIEKTNIRDLIIIKPAVFKDSRGYFFESFNSIKFEDAGINVQFVQDNVSKSLKGAIRGLHYQTGAHAQGKLCSVLKGKVLDVAVDIRFGSPTFGEYVSIELSDENNCQFWIPPGFAHGFSVLSDEAVFHYKCTSLYNKQSERCILYNDPDLNINWDVDKVLVSEKDLEGLKFKDIQKDFIYTDSLGG